MMLFIATNGYVGQDGEVKSYVIALNETRALELAREAFKNDSNGYPPAYWENAKVKLLHGDCTKEYISEVSE